MLLNEFMPALSFVSIPYLIIVVASIDKVFAGCTLFCHENETYIPGFHFFSLITCLCLFLDYLDVKLDPRPTRSEVIL